MILVVGPSGCGKTNTLYSATARVIGPEVIIMTCEDPVEFNIRGINQVQMKESIGLNFAATLRSFLRQDPNIILVGEIRDFETAEIAVKASLTGHLVLSTLHTTDAPTTVSGLVNMAPGASAVPEPVVVMRGSAAAGTSQDGLDAHRSARRRFLRDGGDEVVDLMLEVGQGDGGLGEEAAERVELGAGDQIG